MTGTVHRPLELAVRVRMWGGSRRCHRYRVRRATRPQASMTASIGVVDETGAQWLGTISATANCGPETVLTSKHVGTSSLHWLAAKQSYAAYATIPMEEIIAQGVAAGMPATMILQEIVKMQAANGDPASGKGQILLVGSSQPKAKTERGCINYADHIEGPGVVIAGNILASEKVLTAGRDAWIANAGLATGARMIAVLDAIQKAKGDIRGHHSAALTYRSIDPDMPTLINWVNYTRGDPLETLRKQTFLPWGHPDMAPSRAQDHLTYLGKLLDQGNGQQAYDLAKGWLGLQSDVSEILSRSPATLPHYPETLLLQLACAAHGIGRPDEAKEICRVLQEFHPGRFQFGVRCGTIDRETLAIKDSAAQNKTPDRTIVDGDFLLGLGT
jgi:hypothetical protein